ncbi:MAG: translation elongation factor Ts [Clostridia bacterium]|jgi:translation elongation factor Ts
MITASQVKELREKTGAGMMECKKVLTETDGDIEKAMELLRERGITKAAKKASRVAAEGLVGSFISEDGKVGAIAEVNAETDFVAENAEFKQFVNDIVKQVALNNPADVEALLEEKFIADPEKTVKEALINKIATIGENITIRRFVRYETTDGTLGQYVHGAGKIAVLVEMKNADAELTKDICMQIAASKPEFLNREQVPQERVDKEMEILKVQAMNEGKPEAIAEKMVQGRIGKFYSDICLVDQEFVKDMDKKVSQLLKEKNAEVVRFARLEKGEGIEKKEENFAEEVAKQLK